MKGGGSQGIREREGKTVDGERQLLCGSSPSNRPDPAGCQGNGGCPGVRINDEG